ncbi:glycoside hydrolase family 5 protein [Breznakiellaceae bacterium SP9]
MFDIFDAQGRTINPWYLSKEGVRIVIIERSFPFESAAAHFSRLRRFGFTWIRLTVSWKEVEPEGPGLYDESYLEYVRKLLLQAEKNGLTVIIEPLGYQRELAPAWTNGILEASNEGTSKDAFISGDSDMVEAYRSAFRHCARRWKKAAALAGWNCFGIPTLYPALIARLREVNDRYIFIIDKNDAYPALLPATTQTWAVSDLDTWFYLPTEPFDANGTLLELSFMGPSATLPKSSWLNPRLAALAGRLISFSHNTTKLTLSLRYKADSQVTAPTELFLPEVWLKGSCRIDAGLRWQVDTDALRLYIWNDGFNGDVSVELRA